LEQKEEREMKLVIVERHSKAEALSRILGSDCVVRATLGALRDLPTRKPGITVEDGFAEDYKVLSEKQVVLAGLKKAAREAEAIFLATDPGREGEALAWHVAACLPERDRDKVKRVRLSEITEAAVKEAFTSPDTISTCLVDAWRAHRVMARLTGRAIKPLLRRWHLANGGELDTGLGQIAALHLIVAREWERCSFVQRNTWRIHAELTGSDGTLWAHMAEADDIASDDDACRVIDQLMSPETGWRIEAISTHEESQYPPPPLTTDALYPAASRALGWLPAHTLAAAQALYDAGLVTAVYTDTVAVAEEAQVAARGMIIGMFNRDYVPAYPYVYLLNRPAEGAGEAIRPTNPALMPDELPRDGLDANAARLYALIWRRFLASQMAPARHAVTGVVIRPTWTGSVEPSEEPGTYPHPFTFTARLCKPVFDGYTVIYNPPPGEDDSHEEGIGIMAPTMAAGETLALERITSEKRATEPARPYTIAGLIDTLACLGVEHPPALAATIRALLDRGYVTCDGDALAPTPLGEDVLYACLSHFPEVFDLAFAETMAKLLDKVAIGEASRETVLHAFYHGKLAPALDDTSDLEDAAYPAQLKKETA
jgi:DNA topoisomerase-1